MPLLTASKVPDGFVEKTIRVNGIAINYAVGGHRPYGCSATRISRDLVLMAENHAGARGAVYRDRA